MNTHPLEVIERLIDVELRQQSHMDPGFVILKLKMELNKTLWHPLNLVAREKDETKLEKHVQLYQRSLLRLMDIVVSYLPQEGHQQLTQFNTVPEHTDAYKAVIGFLQTYLKAMQREFGRHMKIDYPVPAFYMGIYEEDIKTNLRLIRDKLSDAHIDAGYWTILRRPLNDLLSASNSPMSYMQLVYLKELYEELIKLLSKDNNILLEELQYLLIYMNFNDKRYISYVTGLITKETDVLFSIREKLLRLFYWEKTANHMYTQTGVSYMPSEPSLQEQLLGWITEKIRLVKRTPPSLTLLDLHPETAEWIRTAANMRMSVNQLNQFIEIVMEKEFYKANKEEVEYLFSEFCLTVPEDNPAVNNVLRGLRIFVKFKNLLSFKWK